MIKPHKMKNARARVTFKPGGENRPTEKWKERATEQNGEDCAPHILSS